MFNRSCIQGKIDSVQMLWMPKNMCQNTKFMSALKLVTNLTRRKAFSLFLQLIKIIP